jgi:hypothetical protein
MRRSVRPGPWALLALVGALLLGCGEPERGDKADGEPCQSAAECDHGFCVADASGEDAVCTRSCGSTSDCPRGWACSGVTEDDVLVCTRGAPTPFGIGARE